MSTFADADSYPFDLGIEEGRHRALSIIPGSKNAEDDLDITQLWISRGIVWYYAFNHEEAIYCFEKALESDKNSVMAHYWISNCHGPNYNTETMNREGFPSAKLAYDFARKAHELQQVPEIRSLLSDFEIAMVDALQCRFNPLSGIDDGEAIEQNTQAYVDAMHAVNKAHPNHPSVLCLYAEALLNISPWGLWDLNTGVPKEHAVKARAAIEQALVLAPNHPGLNHFMVHLMEMSPTPEVSLPSCAVLRKFFPSAGHLIHMPSHIYVLLGMWEDAVDANVQASVADALYVQKEGIYNYYTGYRIHNLHFIAYAAMFQGQFEPAMNAAAEIKKNLPDDLLANAIMNKFFEAFLSVERHVLIRFGRWEQILGMDAPADPKLHPYLTATHHYASGIAHAVLGDTVAAKRELETLLTSAPLVPPEHVLHNNSCSDLLEIAVHMLQGELKYRTENYDEAFWELEMACSLSDELVYDEPWGWMQPPGHALGALLLEQGRVAEAEARFRKDMDTRFYGRCHPNNIWALKGLHSCLKRRQGNSELATEIAEIEAKIATFKTGDSKIEVACMCARKKK
ncbi:TPR domain protein [Ochromonadaceae sp. CCMP2298]|nr:TPR domain protein [Ochromonadaceae sp. CCMP2298]|eukprot:CAMPEP_0173197848 /NCGR_PEP_ID=MMETSP1141-20130122/16377_1 /TAXON_ID=483371 /ORGANISM="non described non described, Strain CCMP2298" /LENGTH=568 /DNA_ID=CAMNT_0014122611 /DNA_START=138 /DNA_END=1844 /DNA_ORIENTATION=+